MQFYRKKGTEVTYDSYMRLKTIVISSLFLDKTVCKKYNRARKEKSVSNDRIQRR